MPPARSRARRFSAFRAGTALAFCVWLAGCAAVRFESEPPGAIVEYSRTGVGPWLPLEQDAETNEPRRAPFSATRPLEGYAFARARLEGHLPSVRRLVNFSRLSGESVKFTLEKTAEFAALEKMDAGLVFHAGGWVDPAERGLVLREGAWLAAADAEALDQKAAGNVLVDGRWISQAEAERLERERLLADGWIERKGRLVHPEEADRLDAVEAQLARLRERGDLDDSNGSFEVTGLSEPGSARLKVLNATSLRAEFLLGGPLSATVLSVEPYQDAAANLPPGKYSAAILPIAPGVYPGYLGEVALEEGRSHTLTYLGRTFEERDLDGLLSGVNKRPPLEVPAMEIPELPERPEEAKDPEDTGGTGSGKSGRPRGGRGRRGG